MMQKVRPRDVLCKQDGVKRVSRRGVQRCGELVRLLTLTVGTGYDFDPQQLVRRLIYKK